MRLSCWLCQTAYVLACRLQLLAGLHFSHYMLAMRLEAYMRAAHLAWLLL
jgi:hypothetical protein